MNIADIAAFLGLFLSIFVLIITRIENRKNLLIHLCCKHSNPFINEIDGEDEEFIVIQIVNNSHKIIFIDENTFSIKADNFEIKNNIDWFGKNNIPKPLNPGDSFEVGINLESFESIIGISKMREQVVPISACLYDLQGKRYKSKKYKYLQVVSEIERR